MLLVISKRILLVVCTLLFGVLGILTVLLLDADVQTAGVSDDRRLPCTVVVDAGHGGEDGGACAADGTVESGLNLEIALRVRDLLRFCGTETRMTREADVSIYSEGAKTLREKKVSDLRNRVEIVNTLEDAILVSIHQNTLPAVPAVRGAQAFYNSNMQAQPLAEMIQNNFNQTVNLRDQKSCKPIAGTIYLMKNVPVPAVLVECGFLSNLSDTALLKQQTHQLRLAASVAAGIQLFKGVTP